MAIEYFVLGFLFVVALIVLLLKIIEEKKSNSSNNEGGLPVEVDFPELDLPPGVTLPISGPSIPIYEYETEDRMLV